MIAVNGQIVSQGSQFSMKDVVRTMVLVPNMFSTDFRRTYYISHTNSYYDNVTQEVITATIDIEDVRSFRGASTSRGMQASESIAYQRIYADVSLSGFDLDADIGVRTDKARTPFYHTPEEEIALGPACWMWDYLRRSKTGGFFLPLSGGIDSCATATIVASMCRLVAQAARDGGLYKIIFSVVETQLQMASEKVFLTDTQVINDARRMTGEPEDSEYLPTDPQEFAK